MDFKPGQRVKVVQRGTLQIGTITLTNNVFEGVSIVRRNADGTYQVRGIISTPEGDEVTIPGDWIVPL